MTVGPATGDPVPAGPCKSGRTSGRGTGSGATTTLGLTLSGKDTADVWVSGAGGGAGNGAGKAATGAAPARLGAGTGTAGAVSGRAMGYGAPGVGTPRTPYSCRSAASASSIAPRSTETVLWPLPPTVTCAAAIRATLAAPSNAAIIQRRGLTQPRRRLWVLPIKFSFPPSRTHTGTCPETAPDPLKSHGIIRRIKRFTTASIPCCGAVTSLRQ